MGTLEVELLRHVYEGGINPDATGQVAVVSYPSPVLCITPTEV